MSHVTVVRVGYKATWHKEGISIDIGYFIDSKCSSCHNELEQYCIEWPTITNNSLEKDGQTISQGEYSNKIVVD